ncbi:MAG: pimelyl-ACP methyl ester esterase BioV [Campylobacterota bacterium]|nr:pimelyl-ACP methyl ester esterase BioV [Campylobacterota bacterium]
MKSLYYNGFCLDGEKELFKDYIIENDYTIQGFSYGAIKAFEKVYSMLKENKRVDLIQLFSPAFFNDKDKKYKRMQLLYFGKDANLYSQNFLKNCGFSSLNMDRYFKLGSKDELEELLYYEWDKAKLKELIDKNIKVEVYLGKNDKIISFENTFDFFIEFADVYVLNNKGHIV